MPWLLCRRRPFTLGAKGLAATANGKAHRAVTLRLTRRSLCFRHHTHLLVGRQSDFGARHILSRIINTRDQRHAFISAHFAVAAVSRLFRIWKFNFSLQQLLRFPVLHMPSLLPFLHLSTAHVMLQGTSRSCVPVLMSMHARPAGLRRLVSGRKNYQF